MADSPFNSAPSAAWLAAFDLKNTGQNPQVMRDSVQPSTEVLPFYLLPWAAHTVESNPAQNSNDGVLITVPDGELWVIEAATAAIVMTPAETAPDGLGWRIDFRRTPAPSGVSTTIASNYVAVPTSRTANVTFVLGLQLPRLLLLGPGGGIACRLSSTMSANVGCQCSVSYYRIPL